MQHDAPGESGERTEPADGAAGSSEVAVPAPVAADAICWRCGNAFAADLASCPRCAAPLRGGAAATAPAATPSASHAVGRLIGAYSGLLALLVTFGLLAMALSAGENHDAGDEPLTVRLYQVTIPEIIVDAIWTIAIVVGVWYVPRPPVQPAVPTRTRVVAWLAAGPLLAGALLINMAYHDALNNYIDFHWFIDAISLEPPLPWELAIAGLTMCVQPGIFEELFFRHTALGTLRSVMGVKSAILVSSAMFGIGHLHAPLSVPYLMLMGGVLGVIRVWSGSLLLPILVHALHNGVVLWMELQSLISK